MSGRVPQDDPKRQHRAIIAWLLAIVVLGGLVSFFMIGGKKSGPEEEIVIVDLTAPPPPPPPPPPVEPEPAPQPEEAPEDVEISEADSSEDLAGDSTEQIDLGLDVGDLASGPGGAFTIDIPKFGKSGKAGEDPFGGEMDSPPTPVNRMPPQYPNSLLKKGVGGKVVVTCVVDTGGQTISSKIKQSSGQPELDKAALQAVGRWKFKPARRNGKPMQATCNIPFTFEVKKS